jgi:hypothetical protein
MTAALGILNLVIGAIYTQYGTMTIIDMRRSWRTLGFSHFGAAWIAMAFTCGPHHLAHGAHLLLEGRTGGALDLVAVVVGFPSGVVWFLLRVEAFRGGRGDRFVAGNPAWLMAFPTLAGVYVTTLVATGVSAHHDLVLTATMVPNILLVGIYTTIGYYLLRTQLGNRPSIGGWSVSGLALTVIFPTCALMHGVWAYYAAAGQYEFDIHGFVIDCLGVPAGLYFLWVVQRLYRDTIKDWNREGAAPRASVAAG